MPPATYCTYRPCCTFLQAVQGPAHLQRVLRQWASPAAPSGPQLLLMIVHASLLESGFTPLDDSAASVAALSQLRYSYPAGMGPAPEPQLLLRGLPMGPFLVLHAAVSLEAASGAAPTAPELEPKAVQAGQPLGPGAERSARGGGCCRHYNARAPAAIRMG